MQFQVPQFIETEDKIIGPLTLRQFLYIAAGGGVTFAAYFVTQLLVFVVITVLAMGLATALAFVKINGQPLTRVMLSAINFYWHPQIYVWQPEHPTLRRDEESMKDAVGEGFSMERMVAGMALRNAWRYLQTGSKAPEEAPEDVQIQSQETYQAYREMTGDRRVARRIDYR
ncbi:MAG: PrgI family protein [Candidatus Liptonbacteria bacterium]|nr:PrgI family protein [Candidatus Liptonbacteria bacterium]